MNVHSTTVDTPPAGVLQKIEDGFVNVVFLVMTVLPILEILLRKFGTGGFPGSSAIVQHLTLWAGFLGAMLCTRDGRHLALSTIDLLPKGPLHRFCFWFGNTAAACVNGLLAYASYKLVQADSEDQQVIFGSIPHWWSEVIMPIAFALMAYRFARRASPLIPLRILSLAFVALTFTLVFFESNPEVLRWPIAILIFLGLLCGAPIFVAMSGFAMLFFFADGTPIASVPTETLRLAMSPTLPAIPLLTAAGFIFGEGGAAQRLVRVSRAFIGWMPGGIAIMICCVCALFTAFTGGSGVTILALGGLVLPILVSEKYPENFSSGLVTASGSLGLLFPPSLPVILYSVVAQIPDLKALFIAGMVPGFLMIALVCVYGVVIGVKSKAPRTPFDKKEAWRSLWEAKWEIGLPITVGAAILGGWATIVEASALACAYAVIVEVFVFKDIPLRDLPRTVARGATLVGSVLIVLGVALGFTSYLVDAEIPALVIDWVKKHIETPAGFLLVLNVMLLVLGSVLEIYSAIVILAPLIAPLGVAYGLDPIHLAIVFLANLELGFLFPPVGLNLFLSSSRFNRPLTRVYRDAFPFLCIMAIGVLIITYLPSLTIGMLGLFGIER